LLAGVTKSGMRSDVREKLGRWLGEDARVVNPLSEQELEQLHDALVTARKNQARALAAASDEAMRQLPALARTGIGRILGR
jgi:hypothetical protein